MTKTGFKNIIFDLGGVILNLDYHRCLSSFEKLGFNGLDQFLSKFHPSGIFRSLEIGQLTEDEFIAQLNEAFQLNRSREDILQAWGSFLCDIPQARLHLLAKLKETHHLYLLSNTSPPHADIFERKFTLNNGFSSIQDFFDGIYYSFNVGTPKPDSRSYEAVLDGSNLLPEETLFIDDSEINTKAANMLGISTILVDDDFTITSIDFENIEKNRNFASGIKKKNQ